MHLCKNPSKRQFDLTVGAQLIMFSPVPLISAKENCGGCFAVMGVRIIPIFTDLIQGKGVRSSLEQVEVITFWRMEYYEALSMVPGPL